MGTITNNPGVISSCGCLFILLSRVSQPDRFVVVLLVKSHIIIFLLSCWVEQLDGIVFSHFAMSANQ